MVEDDYIVRIRISSHDRYEGLKGQDYLNARGLNTTNAMSGTREGRRATDREEVYINMINNWMTK